MRTRNEVDHVSRAARSLIGRLSKRQRHVIEDHNNNFPVLPSFASISVKYRRVFCLGGSFIVVSQYSGSVNSRFK
jgi:hypothetical protein